MTTNEQLGRPTQLRRRHVDEVAVRAVAVVAAVVAALVAVSIAVPSPAGAVVGHAAQGTVLWQTSADGTDFVIRTTELARHWPKS
jgi:hypothetical protein